MAVIARAAPDNKLLSYMTRTGCPIVRLHRADNVAVACRNIAAGEVVRADDLRVAARQAIPVGHKMAIRRLDVAEKIVKWGAPIGSCTSVVRTGDHVHGHNMRSDYIPSHTREGVTG